MAASLDYDPISSNEEPTRTLAGQEVIPTSELSPSRASYELEVRFRAGQPVYLDHEPHWLAQVVERLNHLLSLPENWNSYNSKSISIEAARSALEFLCALPRDISAPELYPVASGGIALEWGTDRIAIEIEFSPESEASLLAEDQGQGIYVEEEGVSFHRLIVDYYPKIEPLVPRTEL